MSRTDVHSLLSSTRTIAGDYVVLVLAGRLDGTTAAHAEEELVAAVSMELPLVVVDLDVAHFVSSAGLRPLVVAARQADRHQTRLALVSCQPEVLDVLRQTGLDELLGVHPSVGRALAAYRHPA